LYTNLCQKIPPPNLPWGFSRILETSELWYNPWVVPGHCAPICVPFREKTA
jgi:hypothetical protein